MVASIVLLASLLAFGGCRNGGDGDGDGDADADGDGDADADSDGDVFIGPDELVPDDLLGTWVRTTPSDTITYEFRADGTYQRMDASSSVNEGSWSVNDGFLELSSEEHVEEDGCALTVSESEASRAAIRGDRLFFVTLYVRTQRSGESPDGTWENEYRASESAVGECDGTPRRVSREGLVLETVTIAGDRFEKLEEGSTVTVEDGVEDTEGDSRTSSGNLRVDGDLIFRTTTESDGEPVPAEEQAELIWGFRVAPDVIVFDLRGNAEHAEDCGYHRQ
jgi:hypothetical protein